MGVTERQVKTWKNMEKGMSVSKAMRKSGYSKNYAKNPQELKQKLGWQQLMDRDLPESLITKKLKELSQASVIDKFYLPFSYTEEDVKAHLKKVRLPLSECVYVKIKKVGWEVHYAKPDYTNRNAAIEKIVKLRGKFAPEEVRIVDPDREKTEEELLQELEELNNSELIRYDNYEKGKRKKKGNTQRAQAKKK